MINGKNIIEYLKTQLKEIKREKKVAWDDKNYIDLIHADSIIQFLTKCIYLLDEQLKENK